MPSPVARGLAETSAVALSRRPRGRAWDERRQMIARHLARALGDSAPPAGGRRMGRLVDRSVASYARYWAESLRIPGMTASELTAGITYDDFDNIAQGRAAGKGTILVLPHVGGWEWAGAQLAAVGHPMSVVVETLDPPELFEWFVAFRRQLGMNVIPAGPGAGAACAKALADNHILCLLSDRLIAGTAGIEVDFFGEPTLLPAGPATLAIRSGAALVPAAVYFENRTDEHWGWVLPALDTSRHGSLREDVHRVTQEMARIFEAYVRRDPTQWHLMQPNWPSDGPMGPPGATGDSAGLQ